MSNGGSDICSDQFEEWAEEYNEWLDCTDDQSEAMEDYWIANAAAVATCGGALATVGTIVGGIVGGAACAVTLWIVWDAADDWGKKIKDCNEMAIRSNEEGEKYKECVNDHKRDSQ